MKLKPLFDNVVIKAITNEEVTKSGIILPDTVDKEKPEQGEIIAVGPGKFDGSGNHLPIEVKVGDIVLFKKYSPDEVTIDDVQYLVLSQNDIIAVLEK